MNAQQAILIVDDDLNVLEVMEARLMSAGFIIYKAENGRSALKILKTRKINLMVSDIQMPGMGGIELFQEVRLLRPDLPVIFLTAYGTISGAVSAVKAGAVDYLAKPFNGKDLVKIIKKNLQRRTTANMPDETPNLMQELDNVKSLEMKKLYSLVKRVSKSDVNVLILGESGVGKERIAHLIHQSGKRKKKPFIVVDCGSTPAGLLESELFGHVKGSFTNAVSDKKGLIQAADKGTLFLDEIGNISAEMQTRLLRFIEDRKIRKIGDIDEIPVDCRIIAATNSNLPEAIKKGSFREDLYYRLRVVTLNIPSLKDRKEDIPELAQYFIGHFNKHYEQNGNEVKLAPETLEWLCQYPWPGNVRELKNALEASIVLCDNGILQPEDLHISGLPQISQTEMDDESDSFTLEDNERLAIIRALKQSKGVQKDAAELLGISRRAIHYKIKKFKIDFNRFRLKT